MESSIDPMMSRRFFVVWHLSSLQFLSLPEGEETHQPAEAVRRATTSVEGPPSLSPTISPTQPYAPPELTKIPDHVLRGLQKAGVRFENNVQKMLKAKDKLAKEKQDFQTMKESIYGEKRYPAGV